MTFFLEYFRKMMGWCPAKSGSTALNTIAGYGTKSGHYPDSPERVITDRIVDYVPAWTSLLQLLAFATGIAAIVAFLKFVNKYNPGTDILLLLCIMLVTGYLIIYSDIKRTTIESGPEVITVKRPGFRTVHIQKSDINNAEIIDNHRPVPQFVLAILGLIIIPVFSVASIYGRYVEWISGEILTPLFIAYLGFFIVISIFFLAIYNYARIRKRYPKSFVITTKKNKQLVIYGKSFEELVEIKENLL
ncbi:DUF1673 family protein [Methanolacinia petrolearia]|uniref:DUF1673 family protein n=1 Tax=Methanolacinia petrolearia TaxID=54120 RepID=UPI003BAA4740